MPQLMINTADESAESLRLLAVLLTSYAGIKDAEAGVDRTTGIGLGQTVQAAVAAHTHTAALTVTAPQPDVDLSKVNPFAKPAVVPQGTDAPSNVLPFILPLAPTPQTVVTPAAQLPATGTPAVLPTTTTVAPDATLPPAQTATVELDKAGIPWDARIHQSNRNKKTDGTWMLKRGLDKAIAEAVLAELTAAKLATLPPVAPAAGPVSLPPAPTGLPLPPPPVGPATGPVVSGTLPPPPAGASLPAVPNGLPAIISPASLTPVQRFSAMMVKINAARASGQIDQTMIDEAHRALDLPQLQLAITQPDKIPLIEAALGL